MLELVAAGMGNARIAQVLVVEVTTVTSHLRSCYRKLGVHSRTAAVAAVWGSSMFGADGDAGAAGGPQR